MLTVRSIITSAMCLAAGVGLSLSLKAAPGANFASTTQLEAALGDAKAAVHASVDALGADFLAQCRELLALIQADVKADVALDVAPTRDGDGSGGNGGGNNGGGGNGGGNNGGGGDGCPCPGNGAAAVAVEADVDVSAAIGDGSCGGGCAPDLEGEVDVAADADVSTTIGHGGCAAACGGSAVEVNANVDAKTDIQAAVDGVQLDLGNAAGDCGCLLSP